MKRITSSFSLMFYCLTMLPLITGLCIIVIPLLLLAAIIKVLFFMILTIMDGDFPEMISWRKIPDALTQLTCDLGHAFGFDLMGTLEKLAKK